MGFHSFLLLQLGHHKKYLIRMIRNVFGKKKLGGYTTSTFLALVPKEVRPSIFNCFGLFPCETLHIKSSPKSFPSHKTSPTQSNLRKPRQICAQQIDHG